MFIRSTKPTPNPLTVTATATGSLAQQLAFVVQPSNVVAGASIAPAVTVQARDALGALVTSFTGNITIALGANPGGATLSGTVTVAAVAGVATFNNLSLNRAGTGYQLTATSGSFQLATSGPFDVAAAAPALLTYTTSPSNAVAGVAIAPAIVVQAMDAFGNSTTAFTGNVTLALAVNPGGATLSGTTTVAAVGGVATLSNVSLNKAASGYTVSAAAAGLIGIVSGPMTITAAGVGQLAFTVQPVGSAAGAPIVPAVQVSAQDAFGNLVSGFTANVTVAIGANPGSSTLTGTTTVAAVAGVATFSDLALSATASGYTLTAASGVLTGTSATFPIGSAIIAWVNAGGGNWSTASNWSLNRVPQPGDSVVIALAGTYSVTLDASPTVGFLYLGGASGTQTFSMSARTLTVAGGIVAGPNGAMLVTTSTINGLLVNQGTLVAQGNSTMAGSFMGTAGSTLRVQGSPSGFASPTVTSGFTNNGLIEITEVAGAYGSQLTVSGTLTNAVGASITSLVGAGGARTLSAELNNQGTLTVSGAQGLTLSRASAAHVNSGTIDLTGGSLTITQSGTTPSLTNTGTLNIAATRTLGMSGGVFDQNAGTLTGTGTLSLASLTWNLTPGFTNATTSLALSSVTVNGPGTLTNASLQTLTVSSSTINAPLVNQGTLITQGTSTIAGSFTASAGSTLRAQGSPVGFGNLTVSSGFTNNGLIEITEVAGAYGSQLTVSGTLVNAVGGTVRTLTGSGGSRTLVTNLDNDGTLSLTPGAAGTLTLTGSLSGDGTIDMDIGGLTAGSQYDRLNMSGALTLGNTFLNVLLFGGFTPAVGNSFTIMTFASATGGFAVANLPSGFGPYQLNATTLVVSVPLP